MNSADTLRAKLEKLEIEELQAIEEEATELQERDEMEAAKDYIPNGKSEEFITMVGSDKFFVNMFIGANGTSKTSTGANIIANIVFGPQNAWFQLSLFKNWPYIKKGRIISDPTTIKEKIIPELIKWLPRNSFKNFPEKLYETAKEGKYYASKFIFNNSWVIDIMSNEQDLKSFESVDLGFVWIDEPMPKDKFLATLARGRLGMIVFWTYTPLFQAGWIKEWMDEHITDGLADYVEAEMEDNCKEPTHGIRGFFEHKAIQRMSDSFPEDEKEARVFGKFGHLLGRVHKKFSRKIHVIKAFQLNEKDWTTYKALDPHPRVQDHVLYLSVDSKGTKIVSAELLSEGLVKRLYSRMIELETKMHFRIEDRIIDPSAFVDDQHRKEKSVGSQLFDCGETWIKGSKNLMAGIKRVEDAFDYEMAGGKFIKSPELMIMDNCPVTIKQLEEYVWAEYKGISADDKEKSGRPKDKNDHMPENLHRLLLHNCRFVPYQLRDRNRGLPKSSGASQIAERDFDPYD